MSLTRHPGDRLSRLQRCSKTSQKSSVKGIQIPPSRESCVSPLRPSPPWTARHHPYAAPLFVLSFDSGIRRYLRITQNYLRASNSRPGTNRKYGGHGLGLGDHRELSSLFGWRLQLKHSGNESTSLYICRRPMSALPRIVNAASPHMPRSRFRLRHDSMRILSRCLSMIASNIPARLYCVGLLKTIITNRAILCDLSQKGLQVL